MNEPIRVAVFIAHAAGGAHVSHILTDMARPGAVQVAVCFLADAQDEEARQIVGPADIPERVVVTIDSADAEPWTAALFAQLEAQNGCDVAASACETPKPVGRGATTAAMLDLNNARQLLSGMHKTKEQKATIRSIDQLIATAINRLDS